MRKIIITIFMLICAMGITAPIKVKAANNTITITANDMETKAPISGMTFGLYKIANITEDGSYMEREDYSRYQVYFSSDTTTWPNYAKTIEGYLKRDTESADIAGITGQNGMLDFMNLEYGLYLLTAEDSRYAITPSLIPVNASSPEQTVVNPKPEKKEVIDPAQGTSRHVLKRWRTVNNTIPESVSVQLLKGREVYDTVYLSADNNWAHTWTNLDPAYDWSVIEDRPYNNYYVSTEITNSSIIITNTEPEAMYVPIPDGPQTPDEIMDVLGETRPVEPGPDVPEVTGRLLSRRFPQEVLGADRLPQTGVLWWPAPIMFLLGLIFLALGRNELRKGR